jgi:hypothetical protein
MDVIIRSPREEFEHLVIEKGFLVEDRLDPPQFRQGKIAAVGAGYDYSNCNLATESYPYPGPGKDVARTLGWKIIEQFSEGHIDGDPEDLLVLHVSQLFVHRSCG